jgi:2-polyprenyl-3-methyl-5-hydroxy-6-metoxy-1,4-benzoquinol methylase
MKDQKQHWETIYEKKQLTDVSWYEEKPENSLAIIDGFELPKHASIIDIGGGDSLLTDHLLALGYTNITVLDISANAIDRAKLRLQEKAPLVHWVISDVLNFNTNRKFDIWHDRAAFHFLTSQRDQTRYLNKVHQFLKPEGYLVMSTFAKDGPEKCSGLPVQRHSEDSLSRLFVKYFDKIKCVAKEHITPFSTLQKFIFCSFKNKKLI